VLEARWDTLRSSLAEAYRLGRDAAPLLPVYWERHWEEPMESVQRRYRLEHPIH
jgi:ubiquinone biosynthesis protein Coq4